MLWADLIRALALVAVIEGLAPFLVPRAWRSTMQRLGDVPERQLRIVGAVLIGAGVLVLQFVHHL